MVQKQLIPTGAVPRSKKETKVINNKIDRFGSNANYWIGLTDRENEGTFVWGSDGSEATYTNWNGREPNNMRKEDCAHIRTNKNNEWNDSKCDQKSSSIE